MPPRLVFVSILAAFLCAGAGSRPTATHRTAPPAAHPGGLPGLLGATDRQARAHLVARYGRPQAAPGALAASGSVAGQPATVWTLLTPVSSRVYEVVVDFGAADATASARIGRQLTARYPGLVLGDGDCTTWRSGAVKLCRDADGALRLRYASSRYRRLYEEESAGPAQTPDPEL